MYCYIYKVQTICVWLIYRKISIVWPPLGLTKIGLICGWSLYRADIQSNTRKPIFCVSNLVPMVTCLHGNFLASLFSQKHTLFHQVISIFWGNLEMWHQALQWGLITHCDHNLCTRFKKTKGDRKGGQFKTFDRLSGAFSYCTAGNTEVS